MTAPQPVIRPVIESDIGVLHGLMRALAEHEGEAGHFQVTPETLRATGFGGGPRWRGLLAVSGEAPCGFANYTEDFHIWSGRPRMTLDDLFVLPSFRGAGVGEALMRRVFAIAGDCGAQVHWQVQTGNDRAIAFYRRLGADYKVTGKCIWNGAGTTAND